MDEITLDALLGMQKLADFKAAFKNKTMLNKATTAVFLVDYKFGSVKATTALLYKKEKDAKNDIKRMKKEKVHKLNKMCFGTFSAKDGLNWVFEAKGGGASLDLVSVEGQDLFSMVKINLKVQQGAPDPELALEAADLADDDQPQTKEETPNNTPNPNPATAEKIKKDLDAYNKALDAYATQLAPKTLKAVYDKLDAIKAKIDSYRNILAQEQGVDSAILALLDAVETKTNALELKIAELEKEAKNDSDVSGFNPQVTKTLQRFIAAKNKVEEFMAANPNHPKLDNAFKALETEYAKAKTEISTFTGTDTESYKKALDILNAEQEKIALLKVAAAEHKEDANEDAALQEELKTILKGKSPQTVFTEWDQQLKSLSQDLKNIIQQAQSSK